MSATHVVPAAAHEPRGAEPSAVEVDEAEDAPPSPSPTSKPAALAGAAPGSAGPREDDVPYLTRLAEVATAFFPIGFIAFGGPQAHIAMLREVFVLKRKWLDEDRFLELMSLGQAMPGPTSTQVATALGISRAGWLGGLVSFFLFDWVGFIVCIAVGAVLNALVEGAQADQRAVEVYKEVVVGMGPAAISQVFLAAYSLGIKVTGGDSIKVALALITCLLALLLPSSFTAAILYLVIMVCGGVITVLDSRRPSRKGQYPTAAPADKELLKRMGMQPRDGYILAFATVALFIVTWVLVLSPRVTYSSPYSAQLFALFQTLFKMGGTIYGGGQVVLPMLENEFVTRCGDEPNYVEDFAGSAAAAGGCSWVSAETFAFGLALAQSLPGPLFNFSAFLGAAYLGVPGGFVGFIGLFAPGIMLIYAFMPFWERLRARLWVRCLLVGMNASSIGLVFAACVQLYFKFVRVSGEAVVMLLAAALVQGYKMPAPIAIFGCAGLGWALFALDAGGPYCHVGTYGSYPLQTKNCL
ncbi:hypothetical protein KFE25_009319 [Diacronema lutheri]|uniref:Chromate transporter n=1 Tax=Diacronema lutheri TaxID=2081491 RepID=A0A8J5XMG8_DIALT|nr:hypothetical protein KFE25_009319 [Diacronema lutheri]